MEELTLAALLDRIGDRTPAPGGGSGAAIGLAVAAGLVEMAARFQHGDPAGADAAAARALELRRVALTLAERELTSYEPVLAALRLPDDDPDRAIRLERAASEAAEPPLQIAAAAAELAELGATLVLEGNPNLRGDALTGVLLAEAAAQAAAGLVAVNLAESPEDARHGEAAARAGAAAAARRRALPSGQPEV